MPNSQRPTSRQLRGMCNSIQSGLSRIARNISANAGRTSTMAPQTITSGAVRRHITPTAKAMELKTTITTRL